MASFSCVVAPERLTHNKEENRYRRVSSPTQPGSLFRLVMQVRDTEARAIPSVNSHSLRRGRLPMADEKKAPARVFDVWLARSLESRVRLKSGLISK